MNNPTTAERLRHHAATLRTNSLPLAALVPLLNKAADELDAIRPSAEGNDIATAAAALALAAQRDWPGAPSHRAVVLAAADKVQQTLASNVQPKGTPTELTDEQIDEIARGWVMALGGDHWNRGERGIKDDSDLIAFARELIAADRALQAPAVGEPAERHNLPEDQVIYTVLRAAKLDDPLTLTAQRIADALAASKPPVHRTHHDHEPLAP